MAVLRCRQSYSYDEDGAPVVVKAGALAEHGDPRVVGREKFWEPAEDAAHRTSPARATETATAEPGARRSVSPPLRKSRTGAAD